MTLTSSLAIIALAALIHASFQLSVSVLTLLSGHAIGFKRPRRRVFSLATSFVAGVLMMTILLLSTLSLVLVSIFDGNAPLLLWAIVCGLMIGVGVAVWLFYYRKEKGTSLWIPRGIAHFLSDRTKATKQAPEAFSLGMMSIVGELLFIIAPLFISALVLVQLDPIWQLVGILLYGVISSISLVTVWVLIGSGHKLSAIQKWRENNKRFLQFAAGAGLVILAIFTYVYEVLGETIGGPMI